MARPDTKPKGTPWFMVVSLLAMVVALVWVGLQLRHTRTGASPAGTPDATSAPQESHDDAPAAPPRGIAGNG